MTSIIMTTLAFLIVLAVLLGWGMLVSTHEYRASFREKAIFYLCCAAYLASVAMAWIGW